MAHKMIIAKVDRVIPIEGATNIQELVVLGEHVVGSKSWSVGDIGVFIPTELQLSDLYCRYNNLYRDPLMNEGQSKRGYFDENRRVRAQTFMKVKSTGLFMPLESLVYFDSTAKYDLGYEFDTVGGFTMCEKYVSKEVKSKAISNKFAKISEYPTFEKHVDSEQFKYKVGNIQEGDIIYFHNKRHGTSQRVAKKRQVIKLPRWKKTINKIVPIFEDKTDYKLVVGTRNVVLRDESKDGFHGSEQFRFDIARLLEPYLEDGMCFYLEVVGYANNKPIMPVGDVTALKDKRYTAKYGNTNKFHYGCSEFENDYHIYRITREDVNGNNIDMSQKEMEMWCLDRGLNCTYEVHPPIIYNGDEQYLRELVEKLTEREDELSADWQFPDMIGEGIILRIEGERNRPTFLKSKSYAFKVMEGIQEADDMETVA